VIGQECKLTLAQLQKHQIIQTVIDGHMSNAHAGGASGGKVTSQDRAPRRRALEREGPFTQHKGQQKLPPDGRIQAEGRIVHHQQPRVGRQGEGQ